MKVLLCISYLGTNYCGFQVQPNGVTIQQKIQDAVQAIYGFRCPITGCSRTDSGVHANKYFCTVDTSQAQNSIPENKISDALNRYLPDDIAVISAQFADDDFHVRYDVISKEYKYLIWNMRRKNPFFSDRAYHRPKPLDAAVMDRAAKSFIGKHDFAAFCAAGSSVTDTTREIFSTSVTSENGFVTFTVSGNGFLYNMVRIMTGTLIEVSEGHIAADSILSIIESCDRSKTGFTVPACGLYLNDVVYKTDIK